MSVRLIRAHQQGHYRRALAPQHMPAVLMLARASHRQPRQQIHSAKFHPYPAVLYRGVYRTLYS